MSPLLIAVSVGTLISVALGVWAFFGTRYQNREVGKLFQKLNELEEKSWKHEDRRNLEARLTAVETQLRLMERYAGDVVHRDDTPDVDRLIEKYQRGETLTPEEVRDFARKLNQIREDARQPPGTQVAAGVILSGLITRYHLKEKVV
jgi:hypothetical protein